MSSTGQAVGGLIGAVVGFYVGGPNGAMYGAQAGMMIGGAIDPPEGPKIEGPRLQDLRAQTATYGAVIPRCYGTVGITGNVFWVENNALRETSSTTEQGGKGGGGGAQVTSYSYSATFAVGLCAGPIDSIRRLWIGPNLVYDAGSTDPQAQAASHWSRAGLNGGGGFVVYRGTDTQAPDPRMEATLGVGNVPAYRGLAYLVFEDLPLEAYGNSLLGAQVRAEVVLDSAYAVAGPTAATSPATNEGVSAGVEYSFDGSVLVCADNDGSDRIAVSAIRLDGTATTSALTQLPVTWPRYWRPVGASDDGSTFWSLALNPNVMEVWPDGRMREFMLPWNSSYSRLAASRTSQYCVYWVESLAGVFGIFPRDAASYIDADGNYLQDAFVRVPALEGGGVVFVSVHGTTAWVGLYNAGAGTSSIAVVDLPSAAVVDTWTAVPPFSNSSAKATRIDDQALWVYFGGDVFRVDASGYSTIATLTTPVGGAVWCGNVVCMVDNSGGSVGTPDALQFYVIREVPTAASLGDIVEAEALQARMLAASDLDVSALTDSVRGYRVAAVSGIRAALEPLSAAWAFDALQAGYVIRFVKRGGAAVATVTQGDLDARAGNDKPGTRLQLAREMDARLPWRVSVRHLDAGREYDVGEQYAERLGTEANNIETIDLAVALTSGEAAQIAESTLYRRWAERYSAAFVLPPTFLNLEPADVIDVYNGAAMHRLRVAGLRYLPDGRVEVDAMSASAGGYASAALGELPASAGLTLAGRGQTMATLIDAPCLISATDRAGFLAHLCGFLPGWRGGALMRSDDGGGTWSRAVSSDASPSPMAIAQTALPVPDGFALIDKESVLTVSMVCGSLSSVTETAMLNGQNWFAVGDHGRWEVVAAQSCVLQGDGTYKMSDLLRGQCGTEWAAAQHAIGDKVVRLDGNLDFADMQASMIGLSRDYKAVTYGDSLALARAFDFTYSGVNLKPLSPVYLNGSRHPSTSDWSLEWVRRSRVDAGWRDSVDAALGETTEAYEVEVYASNAYATLKRTITGLTTPEAIYTSAEQVADFGGAQSTLYLKVYQISSVVGRGYPLTASITR